MALEYMTAPSRARAQAALDLRADGKAPRYSALPDGDVRFVSSYSPPDGPEYQNAADSLTVLRNAHFRERAKAWRGMLNDGDLKDSLGFMIEEAEKILGDMGEGSPALRRVMGLQSAGERYIERENMRPGIRLGLGPIDDAIRGLTPGQVMVIGGKSGVGKTALALYLLRHVTEHGSGNALFVSIEMPAVDIWERMAQSVYRVSHQVISNWARLGNLKPEKIQEAYPTLRVVDSDTVGLDQLSQFIRMEKRSGRDGLVVLDYMQRMRGEGRSDYERMSNIAKGLKGIAKSQDVPLVALSQLSRTADDSTTPVKLSMFRDSGQIEEAADYALGTWIDSDSGDLIVEGLKLRRAQAGIRARFSRAMEEMNLFPKFRVSEDDDGCEAL